MRGLSFSLLACVLAALLPCPVLALPVLLDIHADSVLLQGRITLLQDVGGKLRVEDVARRPEAFVEGSPQIGRTASAWWLRAEVRNDSATQTWWLDTGNRNLQELDVYVLRADGGMDHRSASSNAPFAARPLSTGVFVIPVTLPTKTTSVVYIRARSTKWLGISLSPELWRPQAHAVRERSQEVQWFVYLGMSLALGAFNLLLFLALRDRNYLWYVLSLATMVWVASCGYGSQGLAFKYLWPDYPLFEQVGWAASILACGIFPAYFVMRFVDASHRMPPALYRLWLALTYAFALTAILRIALTLAPALLPFPLQYAITSAGLACFGAAVVVATVGISWLAWCGERPARFILVAWSPVAVAAVFTSFLSLAAPTGLLMWASACEFVLMSLALADKFNQERRAREQAQTALVLGLQDSERALEERVRLRTTELQKEKQHSADLLHNILPVQVARELSETGATTPRRHESVTVLFSDFCGFTQAVASMPAERMVAELNDLFSAFDRLADECRVEKIKTIGDAYMAVAGLDEQTQSGHAERCVELGLKMVAFVRQRNERSAFKWELRVGVHTGPVVSGVVGHRKYAFDIWGDAVNIAARMESAGEPAQVNISAYTYDLARSRFNCRYRGKVEAKGKGLLDMYFVETAG